MHKVTLLCLTTLFVPLLATTAQPVLKDSLLSPDELVVDAAVIGGQVFVRPLPARFDALPKTFVDRAGRQVALDGAVSTGQAFKTSECETVKSAVLIPRARLTVPSGMVLLGTHTAKKVMWTAAKALGKTTTPSCVEAPRKGLRLDRDWETKAFRVRGIDGQFVIAWFADTASTGECADGGANAGRGSKVGAVWYVGNGGWCQQLLVAETDDTSSPCTRKGSLRTVEGVLTLSAGGGKERWLRVEGATGPDGARVSQAILLSQKPPLRARSIHEVEVEVGCPTGP